MDIGPTLLDTLCIEVTARCPLRCVHCSACASPERTQRVDPAIFRAYLATSPHLQEIYLSGGEPFEHPELESLVAAVTGRADRIVLYSSGTMLADGVLNPIPEHLLARLAAAGTTGSVQRIDLSIYSSTGQRHEFVTATPGSLAVTLASARRIRDAGIELGLHFVPLSPVEDCLPEVARLALELGATRLHILAPARQGRAFQLAHTNLSPRFLADVRSLLLFSGPLELVLSSNLRRALGQEAPTERDGWRSGFIDVNGYFYAGEGLRVPDLRSVTPVLARTHDPQSTGRSLWRG